MIRDEGVDRCGAVTGKRKKTKGENTKMPNSRSDIEERIRENRGPSENSAGITEEGGRTM